MNNRPTRWTRRRILKLACGAGLAGVAGLGYTAFEASWVRVAHATLTIPRLPPAFAGKRVVFMTDIHHGPYTGLDYVKGVVGEVNKLKPDLILFGGDFVLSSPDYIDPCFNALGELSAPLGVFGVLGNHDHWESADLTKRAFAMNGITELTNSGEWLRIGSSRLRICGIGDLWMDHQDLSAALGNATTSDACILLSHNPDFAETLCDPRVSMMLSGHTHGGQAVFPVIGAPIVPSRYGQKYLHGLVQAPATQIFISRGLGTITPPLRFCCRPEINVFTLA